MVFCSGMFSLQEQSYCLPQHQLNENHPTYRSLAPAVQRVTTLMIALFFTTFQIKGNLWLRVPCHPQPNHPNHSNLPLIRSPLLILIVKIPFIRFLLSTSMRLLLPIQRLRFMIPFLLLSLIIRHPINLIKSRYRSLLLMMR